MVVSMRWFVGALLSAALVCSSKAATTVSDFDWNLVTPSLSLNYTPCYENHKCARLLLPLDWLDPANDANVTVAIVARPAVVDETDPSFGGTIIVNPGGPGSSGIDFLLGVGGLVQARADGKKKYEILSFDPRGVGLTTPSADCFRNEYARGIETIRERAIGYLNAGEAVLKRRISQTMGFAQLCHKGGLKDDVRNYMSTTSVARDMAKIVDELDALRHDRSRDHGGESTHANLELRSEKREVARIQYWGWSYGTDLGNYFASMFPGRVERMILEGVQDVQDYANGTWFKFGDVEKIYDYFWDRCYEVGESCALYQPLDTEPGDARARFETFVDELNDFPSSYVAPDGAISSITKEDVMLVIFAALAQPIVLFPGLAMTLSLAMAGDFKALYMQLGQPSERSCPRLIPDTYTWKVDATRGIACGDGEPQDHMTIADYQDYMAGVAADAPNFWPFMADIRLPCLHWPFRPKDRFMGPWVTPRSDPNRVAGKPTAPLLFISSLYDPLTPASNAVEMSKNHPGSTVLVQDNFGHGTILTPSECRDGYIKKYLETGEVPPDDIVCASDCAPFQDCSYDADLQRLKLAHAEDAAHGQRLRWFSGFRM